LVSAFIVACNGNVNDFVLSINTEKRRKSAAIESMAEKIKTDYKISETPILRWDGKKINGKERCSVVLDGDQRDPMHVGSPVLPAGNAAIKTECILNISESWGINKENEKTIPVGLGFDTTSTNTGQWDHSVHLSICPLEAYFMGYPRGKKTAADHPPYGRPPLYFMGYPRGRRQL
jgi:hypothetical protein